MLGHIAQKHSVHYGGHIFSPILLKHCQNVCLNDILDESENGLCRVKNWVTRLNLKKKKKSCACPIDHNLSQILFKLGQNTCTCTCICLNEILDEYGKGSCRVKN